MRGIRKKRWFALFLLVLVILLFVRSEWLGKLMYPIRYKQEIEAASANVGVDPYLVAAIIRVESNYKPDLESHKGALGIMQIMPETAQWISARKGLPNPKQDELLNPEVNIRIGTAFLAVLLDQFDQNHVKAVASYNAGQGNVNKWLSSSVWDGRMETLERIPFWETRKYVSKVMYYYKKYREIYAE